MKNRLKLNIEKFGNNFFDKCLYCLLIAVGEDWAGGDFKRFQEISNDLMTYINDNLMSCIGLESTHYTFYC